MTLTLLIIMSVFACAEDRDLARDINSTVGDSGEVLNDESKIAAHLGEVTASVMMEKIHQPVPTVSLELADQVEEFLIDLVIFEEDREVFASTEQMNPQMIIIDDPDEEASPEEEVPDLETPSIVDIPDTPPPLITEPVEEGEEPEEEIVPSCTDIVYDVLDMLHTGLAPACIHDPDVRPELRVASVTIEDVETVLEAQGRPLLRGEENPDLDFEYLADAADPRAPVALFITYCWNCSEEDFINLHRIDYQQTGQELPHHHDDGEAIPDDERTCGDYQRIRYPLKDAVTVDGFTLFNLETFFPIFEDQNLPEVTHLLGFNGPQNSDGDGPAMVKNTPCRDCGADDIRYQDVRVDSLRVQFLAVLPTRVCAQDSLDISNNLCLRGIQAFNQDQWETNYHYLDEAELCGHNFSYPAEYNWNDMAQRPSGNMIRWAIDGDLNN